MIALFLLLVIAAIVLGIVGVVAKGLLYLLIIGIVVFLGALTLAALRMRRRAVPLRGPVQLRPSARRAAGTLSGTPRTAAQGGRRLRCDTRRIVEAFHGRGTAPAAVRALGACVRTVNRGLRRRHRAHMGI